MPTFRLRAKLAELLYRAHKSPYHIHRIYHYGLRIDLRMTDSATQMQVSRRSKKTNLEDWRKVTASFPYTVIAQPKLYRCNGRVYYRAAWITPPDSMKRRCPSR